MVNVLEAFRNVRKAAAADKTTEGGGDAMTRCKLNQWDSVSEESSHATKEKRRQLTECNFRRQAQSWSFLLPYSVGSPTLWNLGPKSVLLEGETVHRLVDMPLEGMLSAGMPSEGMPLE